MSFNVRRNWIYHIVGTNIHLWQYVGGGNTDLVAGYRVRLPSDYFGNQLIYPNENITNGLMFEGTAFVEPFVNEDPNELDGGSNPTLSEDATPDEASHLNLTRMLSLAAVDYVKAMLSDIGGELEKKEYYMKEFWKKVADNESNKRRRSMTFPMNPYAVR